MADDFPVGQSALHPDWPGAEFNVSGMFNYYPVLLNLFKVIEEGFGCRPPVEAVHGAPSVSWNGGRTPFLSFNAGDLNGILNDFHSKDIGCFLTFSNHLLEAGDLNDSTCNFLLDSIALRADRNGVIVASDRLSNYIAAKHPDLRQIASIVKTTVEGGRGNAAHYRELGQRFYRYILHPDDCHDPKLLDQLDREKVEILINENCLGECPRRPRHYDAVARAQLFAAANQAVPLQSPFPPGSPMHELEQVAVECQADPIIKQIGLRRRNCNLTRGELKAIYDMGFRHFKIQGRTDKIFTYVYDLARYTLEPEIAAPLVYKTLCQLIRYSETDEALNYSMRWI